MAAQCCTDSRAHTDVHPAVTSNHDKGEVFLQAKSIQLTAAFAFPEHFHDTGQRSCTVLEQVVDERRFMSRIRVAGSRDHRAAGVVQGYNIPFDAFEEQLQTGENTAARTCAMPR
ncbi:hypothetical protein D3C75_533980 [compost metagenome]